jgi:hypothetical protein
VFPVNIIHAKVEQLGLKYLVIGGHAVNAYGEPRTTIDVDFLACKDDRQTWITLLQNEGFKMAHDGGNFIQFSPPYGTEWNLDLMFVNRETFSKLHSDGRQVVMLGIATLVPSAQHLIGLKLHALKYGPDRRHDKDIIDVLTLIRNAAIDPRSELFKKLIDQFGTHEIYEQILRAVPPG